MVQIEAVAMKMLSEGEEPKKIVKFIEDSRRSNSIREELTEAVASRMLRDGDDPVMIANFMELSLA